VVPKTYIPTYKEFEEYRWFTPSGGISGKEVQLLGRRVPFGIDLLFTTDSGIVICVDICEDLWASIPPSTLAALAGANIAVNLSASNELIGKSEYRRDLIVEQSARHHLAYTYVSSGVSESTNDTVFGGHAVIAENGSVLQESARFKRESILTVADVDIERLQSERLTNTTYGESQRNFAAIIPNYRRRQFYIGGKALSSAVTGLLRHVDAHPFVPKDPGKLRARCEEIFNIQVQGLIGRLLTANVKQVTIGVSGGLDSTLALLVTVKAFDALGLPRSAIKAYTLPGFGTTNRTKTNAHKLMKELGVTAFEVDIREMCLTQMRAEGHKPFGIDLDNLYKEAKEQFLTAVRASSAAEIVEDLNATMLRKFTDELHKLQASGIELKDLHFENVQARARTKILMDNGFVVGTGDLSECAIGWCTYNGDHMSMYNVNIGVPKTLVKFLVAWAAENQFDGETRATLVDICGTEISPELLPTDKDGKVLQKTESVVGPYELTDFFIYHLLRWGSRPEKILFLAEYAQFDAIYSSQELRSWLRLFIIRFFNSQFKRTCVPNGSKVGGVSLSPRGDLRMPSDAAATLWLKWAEEDIAA
jgi:NAD+ synthase (glutamine-hydrolysing)